MSYMDLAEALVKQLEGCRLAGYLDSTGHPTNGYGNRRGARVGQTITQDIADHDLEINLEEADTELTTACGAAPLAALRDHQRAALVSFVFNVGANPQWAIFDDVRRGNLDAVPNQLRRFVNGKIDGREEHINGLEYRREAEIVFWNTADLSAAVAVTQTSNAVQPPPSSYTRAIVTPPTPLPEPPHAKTSMAAKVVTAVAGLGATAAQLHDVIAPHILESHIFQQISVSLTFVVVACACVGVLIHANQQGARAL